MTQLDPELGILAGLLDEYRRHYNFESAENLDRSGIEHLYKMDCEFTAYDIAPPLEGYKGWQEYGKAWSQVLQKYSSIRFEFRDEPRIFRKGDVAWMSFAANWAGTSRDGNEFCKEFRMTLVWVRSDDGRWRITHEHGSSPRTFALARGEIV